MMTKRDDENCWMEMDMMTKRDDENCWMDGSWATFAQPWMNLCSMIRVAVATICPSCVSSTTTM